MPKMNVNKSITVNAQKEKIKLFLADFHNWKNWSPWLICEPEASISYASDGKYYKWEGKRVGTGEMTVIQESDDKIEYDLTFLKPWKSKAKVAFHFTEKKGQTELTWTMDSSLPFFMFWMKKAMQIYIGMDYERGLKMLKEELEHGSINSKLEFIGNSNFEGTHYIGIKTSTAFSSIDKAMENDFSELHNFVSDQNISVSGMPFSQYQKFDLVKDKVVYVAGFPVSSKPDNLPENMFYADLPNMKTLTVRHKGTYEHLGNAWTAIMMMERNKEFKKNKKAFPLEIYRNDLSQTAPEDLVTDISMPIL
jgi:predicted transcriptional regulator YdeE